MTLYIYAIHIIFLQLNRDIYYASLEWEKVDTL